MKFLKKIETLERLDQLIRLRATGTPDDLARRLGVSRRSLYDILNVMKEMNAPIEYCTSRKSYFYSTECKFEVGFKNKRSIVGGMNFPELPNANKMHQLNVVLNRAQ